MQEIILHIIERYGYFGVFFLILIENVFPPIPSEVILLFSGFFSTYTNLKVFFMIIASTFGSLIGALILYYIGKIFNKERLKKIVRGKIGKVLFLKEKDIDKSDEQTQKEWEEDVTSFLALHNTLLNSLKRIDTDVMTKYAKELQSNAKEYEKALEEMGIVIDDSGAFSISKEGLVQSDNEKWQEFVKKTQALSKETQVSAKSSLDSITTNRILHGISYNKYGKES